MIEISEDNMEKQLDSVLGRSPSVSKVEMSELVLPNDTNVRGTLLGGRLMNWIDIAGAMSASKYSNWIVVTAAVDSLDFRHPIKLGDMVRLQAKVTWTGKTSIEVTVKVYSENFKTGRVEFTNRAFIIFVALDDEGRPTPVPPLSPETEEEKRDYVEAELRHNERIRRKNREIKNMR